MKETNNTQAEVKKSTAQIYAALLNKREDERKAAKETKIKLKEEEEQKYEDTDEKAQKLSKKEKLEQDLVNWQSVLVGLTGDDLEYKPSKKNSKKKYKKWITDEIEDASITTAKTKKKKKHNYRKEFEPELNMLKNIVNDQNKFTIDLLKRFNNAAGPITKDAMPLNKTMVELASAINASRSNSLGLLREISGVKKSIAELYFKQLKEDREGGSGTSTADASDLGLLGSDIMRSMFSNNSSPQVNEPIQSTPPVNIESSTETAYQINTPVNIKAMPSVSATNNIDTATISSFDPNNWDGAGMDNTLASYEAIPHSVIVEWHKDDDKARYVAVRNDNGQELEGCPVPTNSVKSINEKAMTATDDFDQVYTLKIV